jgi:hypothetical protein
MVHIFLQAVSLFEFDLFSFKNFVLQFLIPKQSCIMFDILLTNTYLAPSFICLLSTSLHFHNPASNHAVPFLSFLQQHIYDLFQLKYFSSYTVSELFSEIWTSTLCLSTSFHLSFTLFVISLKLHLFLLHTNANPILYSSSHSATHKSVLPDLPHPDT